MTMSCDFHVITTTKHERGFIDLDDFVDNLYDLSSNIKDDVKAMAATDAAYMAKKLSENYTDYMAAYGKKSEGAKTDDVSTDESDVKLTKNRAGQWAGAPKLEVNETKTGFTVKMSGKDILYQEFGTGTVGEGEYPGKLPNYWHYASGEKIIQNYRYINSSFIDNKAPKWYRKAIKEKIIPKSAKVWHSPIGITEGNHAGAFMYDTWMDYRDDLETGSNLQLGRNNLNIYIKNKLSDK